MLFESLSFRFELRSDDPELGRRAMELIEPFARPLDHGSAMVDYSINGGDAFTLHRDGEQMMAGDDSAALIGHLLWLISGDTVELADGYLLVHAGAVVGPNGRAVLILGESGSGKTTLVAALVQEGFGYLSDEAAAIDLATGLVHPWPRPLGLGRGSRSLPRFASLFSARDEGETDSYLAVDQLRPGAVADAVQVGHVIDHRFLADAPTRIERLSRGTALVRMGSAAPRLRREGDRGLSTLADIMRNADAHDLLSGDLELAVAAVRAL